KIQAAVKTWKHASTTAAVAKPALRWIGSLKKSRKYPFERVLCAASRPAVSSATALSNSSRGAEASAVRVEAMRFTTRPELRGTFGMVASTHWLASAAGMAMLERGGNAFDAAVATG